MHPTDVVMGLLPEWVMDLYDTPPLLGLSDSLGDGVFCLRFDQPLWIDILTAFISLYCRHLNKERFSFFFLHQVFSFFFFFFEACIWREPEMSQHRWELILYLENVMS